MRSVFAGLVVLCAIATAGDVSADVSPAPTCPNGTYSAYLKGRHCVKNGYVLRENEQGYVEQVAGPEPVKANEPSVTTPPAAGTTPEKKPASCAMTDRSSAPISMLGLFAALGLLLLARRRRAPAVVTTRRAAY